MATKFITVRRRDDHSVTAEIAPRALRHFPDWERVPDDKPGQATTEPADTGAGVEATRQDAGSAPEPPKSKRRAAATESKE